MSDYSKNIVYLSQEQYNDLITNGSITVNDVTVTYNENDIYVTPQAEPITDVKVVGTSASANGVANIPEATNAAYGVVKVWQPYGIKMHNGALRINGAPESYIKGGAEPDLPIVPTTVNAATFYGLAKAAGHDEKDSTEPIGTYTPEAKGAIQSMLGTNTMLAPDENDLTADKAYATGEVFTANGKLYKATAAIPVDGAIITDGDDANCEETSVAGAFVKKTDYATSGEKNTAGLVWDHNGAWGIKIQTGSGFEGALAIIPAREIDIKDGVNNSLPVVPGRDHFAAFYGLAKAAGADEKDSTLPIGTYTDAAKSAIRSMIGATSNNVIAVQDTQPTDADTKIWLPETAPEGIEVPTMDDMNAALATKVGDVQVNGTSVVTDGVANIPIADAGTAGVSKAWNTYGVTTNNSGNLMIFGANETEIKEGAGLYRPIIPARQHTAAFYGLAKAAGDTTQSTSDNAVGTYTSEAKSAIQQMLGVPSHDTIIAWTVDSFNATSATIAMHSDSPLPITGTCYNYVVFPEDITFENTTSNPITIRTTQQWSTGEDSAQLAFVNLMFNDAIVPAGTTLTVAAGTYPMMMEGMTTWRIYTDGTVPGLGNYVKKTDYAYQSHVGVVKIANQYGIDTNPSNGTLLIKSATSSLVKNPTGTEADYKPIVPNRQHESVFYGLAKAAGDSTQSASSNNVGTYTDNAKASIKAMLGIQDGSTGTVVVSGTDPVITAVENTRYVCGEVTSLNFTPPASGISIVRFTSGTSVTVLTIPSTVKFPGWFDHTDLETNTIYEICVTDGEFGAVMSWAL